MLPVSCHIVMYALLLFHKIVFNVYVLFIRFPVLLTHPPNIGGKLHELLLFIDNPLLSKHAGCASGWVVLYSDQSKIMMRKKKVTCFIYGIIPFSIVNLGKTFPYRTIARHRINDIHPNAMHYWSEINYCVYCLDKNTLTYLGGWMHE